MDTGIARFACVALASSVLAPACGASDSRRAVNGLDASPDGPAGTGGAQSSSAGGKGGAVGTGGAPGSGGTSASGGAGTGGSDRLDSGIPDASLDGAPPAPDATISCVPDDTDATPPTLTSATLIAPGEIRLAFSEPVRSPVGVSPTRFRLSIGVEENLEGNYVLLQDPSLLVGPDGGIGDYAFASLAGPCGPTLTATLRTPLPMATLCAAFANLDANLSTIPGTVGLYLHFLDETPPTVTDRASLPLASISPEWVTPVEGSQQLPTSIGRFQAAHIDAFRVRVRCGGDAGF
jgi:hypothetical protein